MRQQIPEPLAEILARRELVHADIVLREHFGLTQFNQLAADRSVEPSPA